MKFKMACCCGASFEVSSWRLGEVDADAWIEQHKLCVVAWHHERGLSTRLAKGERDDGPS